MNDAELYAKIVAVEVPCPGQAPHPDSTSAERFHGSQCCGGLLIVPLLPGLRVPCNAMRHVPLTHEMAGCGGYQAKPLSLEVLLLALAAGDGWNPLVNVGRTFTRNRWEAVVDGYPRLGATPLAALLLSISAAAGRVEHD